MEFSASNSFGAGRCGASQRRRSSAAGCVVLALACFMYTLSNAGIANCEELNAYEQLEAYGFPSGLLPHIVTGYELNDDGTFAVYLSSKCQVDIPSAYPVVYSTKITGNLSYQSLTNLSGVNVKIYFFWLGITSIKVKDDSLEFNVGFISSTYPIHPNFDENPFCLGSGGSDGALYLEK